MHSYSKVPCIAIVPFKHNKTFVILLSSELTCGAGHLDVGGEEEGVIKLRSAGGELALMRRPGIRAGSFLFVPLSPPPPSPGFLIIPP